MAFWVQKKALLLKAKITWEGVGEIIVFLLICKMIDDDYDEYNCIF